MIQPKTSMRFFFLAILFAIAVINSQNRVLQQFFARDNMTAADTIQSRTTSHQDEHEHELLSSESMADRMKNTNSSDYRWVGNQWVPPPGVPVFTSSQIKKYFSKRNVLVIGDSTSRRMHVTMLSLMGAADLDNVKKIEVDDPVKL
jgi:hypothetical protein